MNIGLIGFMGTGKSSVGRLLADQLGMEFLETDAKIEQIFNKPISEILPEQEKEFRFQEEKICAELHLVTNSVISFGGGVIINPKNVENIRKNSMVFLLKATPPTILKRVQKDGIVQRPLLKEKAPLKSIVQLLKKRAQLYETAAHYIIDTEEKSLPQITQEIIMLYQEKPKND